MKLKGSNMEELVIPEKTKPKHESITFKCSTEDKASMVEFCDERNYRMSAFLRVAVLSYMNKQIKKDNKKGKKK